MSSFIIEDRRRILLYVLILIALYTMPILMADRYYIDDLGRSARGYYGGSSNGRPMADLIMFLIGFGGINVDLSPLPMMIAVVVFSVSSVHFVTSVKKDHGVYYSVLLPISIIINPFILENLSYKYDVVTMIVSMSSILIAYSGFNNNKTTYLFGTFFALISLLCYQAAIGLFASLAIFEFIFVTYNNSIEKKTLKACFLLASSRFFQLLTAIILYKLIISVFFPHDGNDYAIKHSEIIPFTHDGLEILLNNLYNFFKMTTTYLSSVPFPILVLMTLLTIGSLIYIAVKTWNVKSSYGMVASAVIITSPLLVYLFSIAHLLLLKHPVVEPRVLISFSAITLMPFYLSFTHGKLKRVSTCLLALFVAFSYTYSYAYGNALKSVKSYEDYVSMSISTDIKKIDPDAKLLIQTSGFMDYPPQAMLTIEKYPSIKKLLPRYLNNNWSWAFHQLRRFGIKNNPAWITSDKVKDLKNMNLLVNRNDYEISSNKEVLLIRLKGKR